MQLTLVEMKLKPDLGCVILKFDLLNNSGQTVIAQLGPQSIGVVDNTNRSWPFNSYGVCSFNCDDTSRRNVVKDVDSGDHLSGCGNTWMVFFRGFLTDPAVDSILVTVNLLGIADAKWRVPIIN